MTRVAIIGAGPAGLTVANLLQQADIECVVLEMRDRARLEERQRAGLLDHHSASVFEEAGIGEEILADARHDTEQEIRVEGESHVLDVPTIAGRAGRIVPQQLVVKRLLATYLDNGGDIRFEALDVAIEDVESDQPRVTYRDPDGSEHELTCAYVAGCAGRHGPGLSSFPDDAVTTYSFDHGVGWFTMLADAPPPRLPLLGVSEHGFAAYFARGPQASRFYLQYWPGEEDPLQWSDEYCWEQLRLRLDEPDLGGVPLTGKEIVEMKSHVTEPMSYNRLFLVGDAAHIITPMGAKGMNLAIADAAVLARAIVRAERDGDQEALAGYSPTCLRRTWDYQEFSRWFLEMMHDSGDDSRVGPFRKKLARARIDRLSTSPTAAAWYADMMMGTALVQVDPSGQPL